MTHTPPRVDAPSPRSSTADRTRWSGAKASAFLRALARSGKVGPCAAEVGMSRQAAYRLRGRAPLFAEYWEMAIEEAARRRASSGASSRKGRGRKPVHPLLARRPPSMPDDPSFDAAVDAAFAGDTLGQKG